MCWKNCVACFSLEIIMWKMICQSLLNVFFCTLRALFSNLNRQMPTYWINNLFGQKIMKSFACDHLGSSGKVCSRHRPVLLYAEKTQSNKQWTRQGTAGKVHVPLFRRDGHRPGVSPSIQSLARCNEQVRRMMLESFKQPMLERKPMRSHSELHVWHLQKDSHNHGPSVALDPDTYAGMGLRY